MRPHPLLVPFLMASVLAAGCAGTPAAVDETPPTSAPGATTTTPPTGHATHEPGAADCAPVPTREAPETRAGLPALRYTVVEPREEDACFGFVGPARATSGWTALTLDNDGEMPHILVLFRLDEGKTYEDVLAAFATGAPPSWAVQVADVGFVAPGERATTLVDLAPGTHVLVCFVDGHHMQGMHRALDVAHSPVAREAPAPTLTFEMDDYEYRGPFSFTTGEHVARFVNLGMETHEAGLVRLHGDATVQEFLDAMDEHGNSDLGSPIGGVTWTEPGKDALLVLDLAPGRYGMVCFVQSDAHDGAPHMALGMTAEFTVEAA